MVQFVSEYIQNIYRVNANKDLSVKVNASNIEYICKFEPIIITIIIDNLLNNSKKANAKNVEIKFLKEEKFIMEYIDNGEGLDASIVNPDDIFEIGITTTDGSGLGLNHIKESLFNMKKSTIEVVRLDKGIKFIIRFNI
jgi:signal transduction histidine kinase